MTFGLRKSAVFEQLFEVLADAEAWPHWASVITNVTWTSPEPRGVGAPPALLTCAAAS